MQQTVEDARGRPRVCLLLGGETGERRVSISSGAAFGAALLREGHSVCFLDPATGRQEFHADPQGCDGLVERFASEAPDPARLLPSVLEIHREGIDVVAILLHGGAGEGGLIQAVLDLLGLPYTGSGPTASALALDKVLTKLVLKAIGVPVAEGLLWGVPDVPSSDTPLPVAPPGAEALAALGGYPVVVKPIAGGSTVGLTIVRDGSQWTEAWRAARGQLIPGRGVMVERYVPGRELTVGILEDRPLPVVEIVPKTGFYDFERKYTKGATEYIVPAPLDSLTTSRLQGWAMESFRALGCRDLARVDFRLDPEGKAACLEVNTIPGMTATSLVPMAAAAVGVGFDALARTLCRIAWDRGVTSVGLKGAGIE